MTPASTACMGGSEPERTRPRDDCPAWGPQQPAPTTRRKVADVELATALASSVLPVPGSPYRITPWRVGGWAGGRVGGWGAARRGWLARAACGRAPRALRTRAQPPTPARRRGTRVDTRAAASTRPHLGRLDADVLVQLRVRQRQLHRLLDLLDLQGGQRRRGGGGGAGPVSQPASQAGEPAGARRQAAGLPSCWNPHRCRLRAARGLQRGPIPPAPRPGAPAAPGRPRPRSSRWARAPPACGGRVQGGRAGRERTLASAPRPPPSLLLLLVCARLAGQGRAGQGGGGPSQPSA